MKRFYKDAKSAVCSGGFCVLLDDKPLRSPGGHDLIVPSQALAEAIAAEWNDVSETIKPLELQQTRLSNTALDRGEALRDQTIEEAAAFGSTDLLCYRAAHPDQLVAMQSQHWDPVLTWLADDRGIALTSTTALLGHRQSDESQYELRAQLTVLPPFELTGIHALTTICSSVAIAFAHAFGPLSAEDAWLAATLDETFQMEEWGSDAELEDALALKKRDFLAASSFWYSFHP